MQWQPTPPPGRMIRPLSLGEILDGGFQLLKRHLGPLVRISALFVVPIQIISILVNLTILPERRTVTLALVRPRWWPVFGYTIVIALLVAVPGLVVGIPAALIANRNTATGVIVSGALNLIVSLFTTPFAAATIVLLYFDLRVRREGFDI